MAAAVEDCVAKCTSMSEREWTFVDGRESAVRKDDRLTPKLMFLLIVFTQVKSMGGFCNTVAGR